MRVAVGPARSSLLIWYYDTLDIAPYLKSGENEVRFEVLRYFAASRSAMPFERTTHAGLTVVGSVSGGEGTSTVELDSRMDWKAQVDDSILFPTGLLDDGFLHVSSPKSRFCPRKLFILRILSCAADQRTYRAHSSKLMDFTQSVWHGNIER